jgi:hypothetical protein
MLEAIEVAFKPLYTVYLLLLSAWAKVCLWVVLEQHLEANRGGVFHLADLARTTHIVEGLTVGCVPVCLSCQPGWMRGMNSTNR